MKYFIVGAIAGMTAVVLATSLTAERTEAVFVYGTLTHPIVRTYACWCIVSSEESMVEGYEKVDRNIVPKRGSIVSGEIIVVSEKELTRLDRYEGTPSYYERDRLLAHPLQPWVYTLAKE